MRFIYKTIDTRTLKGLEAAENLKAKGWKIISVGFWLITFERKAKCKKQKSG